MKQLSLLKKNIIESMVSSVQSKIIPAAVGHPHIAKNNLYGLFIRIHNEVVFQSHSQVLYSLINFIMI
jgi:hypothetical protein